jgi:uncharacterized membrane protein
MSRLLLVCGLTVLSAAVAHAQPAPALTLPYVAAGHEPEWRLDIAADGRITLLADYGATTLSMPARAPEPVAGGRRYAGNADGRVLIVTVIDRICQDDMTGVPRPHTVTVTIDEAVLKGCGGACGDDGRVAGSASCNSDTGGYALSGEGVTRTGDDILRRYVPAPRSGAR